MSEFEQGRNENPFQELAEAVVNLGQGIVAYRDFIGRKKAALVMKELGIDTSKDELLETALTDVFGTCVTTGMTLVMRKETDEESFDENVQRLTDQLPEPLKPILTRFIPYFVDQGVQYQTDTHADDEIRRQWETEFKLLNSLDSSS